MTRIAGALLGVGELRRVIERLEGRNVHHHLRRRDRDRYVFTYLGVCTGELLWIRQPLKHGTPISRLYTANSYMCSFFARCLTQAVHLTHLRVHFNRTGMVLLKPGRSRRERHAAGTRCLTINLSPCLCIALRERKPSHFQSTYTNIRLAPLPSTHQSTTPLTLSTQRYSKSRQAPTRWT
jgi:hypothetical protein